MMTTMEKQKTRMSLSLLKNSRFGSRSNMYCFMLFLEKLISVSVSLCGHAEGETSCSGQDS
jgi:hypothetical protein